MQVEFPADGDTGEYLPGVYGTLLFETLGVAKQKPQHGSPVNADISCIFGKVRQVRVGENGHVVPGHTTKVAVSGKHFFKDVAAKWKDKKVTFWAVHVVKCKPLTRIVTLQGTRLDWGKHCTNHKLAAAAQESLTCSHQVTSIVMTAFPDELKPDFIKNGRTTQSLEMNEIGEFMGSIQKMTGKPQAKEFMDDFMWSMMKSPAFQKFLAADPLVELPKALSDKLQVWFPQSADNCPAGHCPAG